MSADSVTTAKLNWENPILVAQCRKKYIWITPTTGEVNSTSKEWFEANTLIYIIFYYVFSGHVEIPAQNTQRILRLSNKEHALFENVS